MVDVPQSINASVNAIRGYFNAYLMHKIYVEYLVVNLSASTLLNKDWVKPSTMSNTLSNLQKFLDILKRNVRNLAQLVSTI